jgi:hypothetical protein
MPLLLWVFMYNGLKPIAIKYFEPLALKRQSIHKLEDKVAKLETFIICL